MTAGQKIVLEDRVLPGGWYTLMAMLLVTLFGFVDRQLLVIAAAPLQKSLQLSDTQLGMVQGLAFAVFTIVAVYPIAWAADRFDRRIVLGGCTLLWAIGTAACGLAQDFTQLFLAAVAIAAGEAALGPITMSVVPDLFLGRKRALANGINYVSSYVGISIALAVGGAAIGWLDAVHDQLPPALAQFESWRLAFFAVALPAPVMLVLIAFARLRHSEGPRVVEAGAPALLPHIRSHGRGVASVLSALGIYLLSFGGFFVWLPLIATRLYRTTEAQNGASMGLATGIGMVGGVLIGTLLLRNARPRLGRRAPIRVAVLVMLAGLPLLALLPFAKESWQLYTVFGGLMLSGTAVGVMVPNILQDMAPAPIRARFIAFYTIVAGLMSGIAPTLVGALSDALTGPNGLMYALVIIALPTWILGILLFRLSEEPFERIAEESARFDRALASDRAQPTTV